MDIIIELLQRLNDHIRTTLFLLDDLINRLDISGVKGLGADVFVQCNIVFNTL